MYQVAHAELPHLSMLTNLFMDYLEFYGIVHPLEKVQDFLFQRITQADSTIFVALTESSLCVGFMQLYPSFSSLMLQRFWVLNDLFVAPAHRGQGVATLLLQKAKALCVHTGACGMMLDTQKTNSIAQKLYESCGFTKNEASYYYYWFTGSSYLDVY